MRECRRGRKVTNMLTQEQFVVNARGKKTGVIMSLKQYEKLMEGLHDLAAVAEPRPEKPVGL